MNDIFIYIMIGVVTFAFIGYLIYPKLSKITENDLPQIRERKFIEYENDYLNRLEDSK